MKLTATILLATAGLAHAQFNQGFEQGDLTGYARNGVPANKSAVAMSTNDGAPPAQGSYLLRMSAGELSQTQAADVLGLPVYRLTSLYLNLGGTPGTETWGDYNVLSVDAPAGDYKLRIQFDTHDMTPDHLDHAFIVNGASQITVLASALDGDVTEWTEAVVSHPGGLLHIVAANGGDDLFDCVLFVDDTRVVDTDNGSFESNSFNHWTIHDDGAGTAFVTTQFIDGLEAPAGAHYARLPAGNVSQADAEEIMGLEPGTLADLYVELGGTGDATGGDYLILAQPFGGSSVSMHYAFKSPDAGSTDSLDHAFIVDSEGNIDVLDTTIGLGMTPTWRPATVDHSGGELFIVSANGGDTDNNATLYLDAVTEGPRAFKANWNGYDQTVPFGGIHAGTIGQLIEPAQRSMLESISFFLFEEDENDPFQYQAMVFEWDGSKIVGDALFVTPIMWTDGGDGGELVHVETPDVVLEKNVCYVAFLTTTTGAFTLDHGSLGQTTDQIPGNAVWHGADEFAFLFNGGWLQQLSADLAFEAELAPYESQVVPNVNSFVEGASQNVFPWSGGGDWRYQQLYAAEQFSGRGGTIDSFAYRVETIGDAFEPLDIDVEIWIGYSNVEPGDLSPVFDDNWLFNKTLVYDGPMTLSSAGLGGFDIVVDVNDVFTYYPNAGNLLVEIIFPEDGQPQLPELDSGGFAWATGGTPWMDRVIATSANAESGILGGDDGHVTRFTFVGEPEAYDPDCNNDGVLNILDFVCFQTAFDTGDMDTADCNDDGVLNILDFVCFQTAFDEACD